MDTKKTASSGLSTAALIATFFLIFIGFNWDIFWIFAHCGKKYNI